MPKKERDTRLKKIKATKNWIEALEVARFNKLLSPIEALLKDYLFYVDSQQQVHDGQTTILQTVAKGAKRPLPPEYEQTFYERHLSMKQRELIDIFLDAVKKRDAEKIHEMANAVEMLKANEGFYDQTRAVILMLKGMVENGFTTIPANAWTVRKVAEIVRWRQMTKDGLDQLRDWCKELGWVLPRSLPKPKKPSGGK